MAVKTPRTSDVSRAAPTVARWWLAALVLLALALPIGSSVFGLYDRVLHWGKLVHGVEGLVVTLVVGLLLLGWRDRAGIDFSDQLVVVVAIFSGMFFGVMWEVVEFVLDWVNYADLQKSNVDTMTDLLWNNVVAVVAAVLAARVYCHSLSPGQRQDVGGVAEWLVDGPSRVLDRHGWLITGVVIVVAAAAVAVVWFAGRPLPGIGNS